LTKSPKNDARDVAEAEDALASRITKEFPNPDRDGCPPSATLRGIAYRNIPIKEAKIWSEHICTCPPCSEELSKLRAAAERERNSAKGWFPRRIALRAAWAVGILLVVVASWVIFKGAPWPTTATLDLRDRVPIRDLEPQPTQPPLELRRSVSRVDLYLEPPDGEGRYEVRIVRESQSQSVSTNGIAKREEKFWGKEKVCVLEITVDLKSLEPGMYSLQIRGPRGEWVTYPLTVR
jgi:hypothetical protein